MIAQTALEGVHTFEQPDGYVTHYRLWGAESAADLVVMLHGGMSHAGWQAPLGTRLAGLGDDIAFLAVDLRGSGLNAGRGHIPNGDLAVQDIALLLRGLKEARPGARVHLAGWCFGAQVATVVAAELADRGILTSLLMVCPGFFFNDRYSDVLDRSIDAALGVVEELGITVEPTRPFIRVPLRPADFTDRAEWLAAIEDDKLKLSHVTVGTIDSWEAIAVKSETDYGRIGSLPVRAVFGTRDRLVDNDRVRAFLRSRPDLETHDLDAGHAVHFEETDALARLVAGFVAESKR
ncbi:alpha/beta hydrolase [Streptomyces thermoalcalitolerans]|uniref:Serine aminopeptidase S33 domain-containing protein n=1 Tax=Streptomyces thermoalcalitolerans TaxID=65605 RepID=A0ABN1NBA3_9ACTN